MKRVLLVLLIYLAMAAPAVAYGPSGKVHYTFIETNLTMMTLNCRRISDIWQQFVCLSAVDKFRRTQRAYVSPSQALELLGATQRMFGQ